MNLAELTKMYDFAGRTFVVTGGTGVLGQAMVKAIVGCGANVALLARNRAKAEPQIAELEGPGRAVVFEADVLDAAALRAAAEPRATAADWATRWDAMVAHARSTGRLSDDGSSIQVKVESAAGA